MTRKANYQRDEDYDLTDAVFPLYSFQLWPIGKGAGGGNLTDAEATCIFIGCQSRTAFDSGVWPLKADSHKLKLDFDNLKAIHQRLRAAGLDGPNPEDKGLLKVIAEIEAECETIETKPDGDFNPLYGSIADGVDIQLPE